MTYKWTQKLATDLANLTEKNKKNNCAIRKQKKLQKGFQLTKKKFGKIDCRKHNFSNSKVCTKDNLTPMNKSIAYNCCKLKRNGLIYGLFLKDGFTSSFLTLNLVMQMRMMTFFQMLLKQQMIQFNLTITA